MAKNIEELLTVNAMPYQGVTFTPLEYKPQTPDINILQKSLDKIEERSEKAATHSAALKKALGEARLKVHQDEESLKWFDEFADNLTQGLVSASSRGDMASAIQEAQQAAGDLTNSPAYLGMIQNTNRYEEELKTQKSRLDKGEISNAAYERWVGENKFNPNWVYNDNGDKIVGSEDWHSSYTPVSQSDLDAMFAGIAKTIAEEKIGAGNGTVEELENGRYLHTTFSGVRERLTEATIKNEFKTSLEQNSSYREAVLQNLRDQVYWARKHENDSDPSVQLKVAHIKETYMLGEIPMRDDKYIDQIVDKYANRFAYDWNLIRSDQTITGKNGSGTSTETEAGILPQTGQTTNGISIVVPTPGTYTFNLK